MKVFATILISTLILANQPQDSERLDVRLVSLVDQVSIAADRRDFDSLHSLMVLDFRYSFGGNRDRDEAIDWYEDRPKLLDELASVLSRDCAITEYAATLYYVCPAAAVDPDTPYYGYRAGFRLKDGNNWQFVWFLAGD